jgi:hypothetical protein
MADMVVVTIGKQGFSTRVFAGSDMAEEVFSVGSSGLPDLVRGNFEDEQVIGSDDLACALFNLNACAADVRAALGV